MAFKVDAVEEHYHAFNCKKAIHQLQSLFTRNFKGNRSFKKVGRAKEALNPFFEERLKAVRLSSFC